MPIRLRDSDVVLSGLPLGGFGCGAFQAFPDGTRGQFTGLNNWEQPLTRLHWFRPGTADDIRQANPFGIFVSGSRHRVAKLLQRAPVAHCPLIDAIELEADFPVARFAFRDAAVPVTVSLTQFSPFIPGEYKDSSLPVVASTFSVTNPTDEPLTVGLLATAINVVGTWNVGRYNRLVKGNGLTGVSCYRRNCDARDPRDGELALLTDARDAEVTYLVSGMYAKEAFRGNAEDRRLDAWTHFAEDGTLPNDATSVEAMGELDEPIGAVAVRFTLAPRETREATFYYSWFMPNHLYGHQYERWFGNARDAASYVSNRRASLYDRSTAWQRTIRDAGLPEWLADALINSLAVYTAASWWTRDGRFAMYENPVKWPLMDSLDVRYYGTLPLAFWFPKFERSTLLQFANAQRRDGRITHDLGRAQLDCPSDGTTAGVAWKDLATKFTLQAYRDVRWSGDATLLRRVYPHVKRAMLWQLSTDRNEDGLPDNEGFDSTYDLWPFYGASAYTGSIHLAALRATEQLALLAKDRAFAAICRRAFKRGAPSFEAKLWNGSHYLAARHPDGTAYDACIVGQLNGQWYAHLLDLGYLLPRAHVRTAVETILRLNGRASAFGAVNAVFPDGRVDSSSPHARNIWPGETYAFCALAIYEGCVDEALRLAQKVWETFVYTAKSVWSQPDVLMAEDGSLGDGEFYIRNVAIWAVALALARHDRRVARMLALLAPALSAARPSAARRRRRTAVR